MKLPYKDLCDIFDSIDKSSYNWVQQFASAVIAANDAKVLADMKPDETMHDEWFYSADKVSALIQDRDSLAARVKELEAQAEMYIDQINSLIKKLPPRPDLRPRKVRFA